MHIYDLEIFEILILDEDIKSQQKQLEAKLSRQALLNDITKNEISREREAEEFELEMGQKALDQYIFELKAEVDAVVGKANAVSPDLVAALQSFSDRALAEKMAESMAPLSILGGKSVAEIFSNMLKGTALEKVLNPVEKSIHSKKETKK